MPSEAHLYVIGDATSVGADPCLVRMRNADLTGMLAGVVGG